MEKKTDLAKIAAFTIWVMYQIIRLALGLVVHPYRTTREIMRGFWFVPLIFLPSALLLWIFLSGRVAAWVVDVPWFTRDLLGIGYSTLLLSLIFWQTLLLYLAMRFWLGFRR